MNFGSQALSRLFATTPFLHALGLRVAKVVDDFLSFALLGCVEDHLIHQTFWRPAELVCPLWGKARLLLHYCVLPGQRFSNVLLDVSNVIRLTVNGQ